MSEAEENRIMAALNAMRIENNAAFEKLHSRINSLLLDGCSKAKVHEKADDDHETRIRDLEDAANQGKGALRLVSALYAAAGAAASFWLNKLLGGHTP